jgi:hypothetical protein
MNEGNGHELNDGGEEGDGIGPVMPALLRTTAAVRAAVLLGSSTLAMAIINPDVHWTSISLTYIPPPTS